MAKKNTELEQAVQEFKEKQEAVRKLKQKEKEKFSEFWSELEDCAEEIMRACLRKETRISSLNKVILKRDVRDDEKWSHAIYEKAFCFKMVVASGMCQNEIVECAKIETASRSLFNRIESTIVGSGTLIDLGDGFVYDDGSHMNLDEALMLIFAYFYRQDHDATRAISKLKEILETNKKLKSYCDFGFDEQVAKYLYSLS